VIVDVRPADLEAVRLLRHRLLRPHQQPGELRYPGDDAPGSLHIGAFADDEIVGIASIVLESPPDEDERRAWRIRGMATAPHVRGLGYGAALLQRCVEHALDHGGTLVWCTARAGAVGFYRRFGFEVRGEGFELPAIGLHFLMGRALG
jgi:GNAT superfamily N-acetyltransferase